MRNAPQQYSAGGTETIKKRVIAVKNKKNIISLILAALLLLALLSGCGAKAETEQNSGSNEFAGQKIGFVTGAIHETIARQHYPKAELCSYNNYTDLAEALDKGKIDAYILDEPPARLLAQTYTDQCVSPVIEPASYAYALTKGSERSDQLREQLDTFIEECSENGVLQEIDDIWLGTDESRKVVDIDSLTGENGTVKFAISTDAGEPFIYLKGDKLVGYEIDIMARFCAEYGYDLEMTNYSFASLLAAVSSAKADVAASTIAITEERKESVNFTIPTYAGGVVIMTKPASAGNVSNDFAGQEPDAVTVTEADASENAPEDTAPEKVGVVANTTYEDVARRLYPRDEICFYNNTADLAKALDKGEIDFYMVDEPVGRLLIKPYPDQHLSKIIEPASFAFAFSKDSERSSVLRVQMDAFIEECRQNGVLQEIEDIWFGDDASKKTVSFDQLTGENGTIRLAISSDIGDPFVYFKNGGLVGYEPDLLVRFCAKYGYDLDITSYTFSALFPALTEGLNDMAACAITVTPEREAIVDFSLPDYESGVLTVSKSNAEDTSQLKVGVIAGTTYEAAARKYYPDAEIGYYNTTADLTRALDKDEIDLYLLDEPAGRMAVQPYPDQHISEIIEPADFAFAFPKDSERSDLLSEQMNAFIEESQQNGVLEEAKKLWLGTDEARKTVDLDSLTGKNGTVRLAASTDAGAPFIYFKENKPVGYEIDLMARFCTKYGYDLEISYSSFPDLFPALTDGTSDIAACAMAITPERQEIVEFSLSTYESGIVSVKKNKATEYLSDNMAGMRIGVLKGAAYEPFTRDYYAGSEICLYKDNAELADALDKGEIDAYMLDEPIGRILVQSHPGQTLSPVIETSSYGLAFAKDSKRGDLLRNQMDTFINNSRQNGVMQELDDIWFGKDAERKTISFDGLTGENGTVNLAVSLEAGAPFVYIKNGSLLGYEIDLVVRFCREYGYHLEMTSYDLKDLLAAVSSGKADLAASILTITAERQMLVNFSVPTYEGGIVLATKNAPEFTLKDFAGKKIGVFTGSIFDTLLQKYIPDAVPEYINGYSDLAAALETGKIDAYIADEPVARQMRGQYPNQVVALQLEPAAYAFMFPKDSEKHQEICRQFNEFLARSWEDGTIADIDAIWFGNDEVRQDVDLSDLTGENGVLEMAVTSEVGAPFVFIKNGHMVGYDLDVAARFCRAYGYGLHISDYNPAGALAATSTGKADMAASTIAVTPERQETSLMSEPDYLGGIVLVVRSDESAEGQLTFWASLRESFERTFLRENRWKLFLSGLGVTFMITMVSMIFGTLGGFVMYLILRRDNKIFNGIWAFFASIMGRTPVVVILMILFYVIFGKSDLSSTGVSIIGFTLLFICTVAELLKMGAGAVEKGQTEAAMAMGFSERQTYLHVIFPQSIEHFLPAYKSEVITLVKATAIVGYIAVQDLTKVSDLIRSRTFEAFFPLIATAIIYYALTFVLTGIIRRINIVTDPRRRSVKRIFRGLKTQ